MKKSSIAFAATVAVASTLGLTAPAVVLAQAASAPVDIGVQQDNLVKSYVGANKEVATANSKMADALGLKDAAEASRVTAEAYKEGATKGALEDADKVVSADTEAVSAELAKAPTLDSASKAKFADGLLTLASGVLKYAAMRQAVSDFSSGMKGASMFQMPKLRAGAYVVSAFPTGMKTLGGALKSAVAFAKSNNIPVPASAGQALSVL